MDYIKRFETYLLTDKNASPATISGYVSDLKNFVNFKGEDLTDITPSDIRDFVAHLTKTGRKRSSINRAVCALKAFFKYMKEVEKVFQESPAEEIRTTKKEKSLPKYIHEQEIQDILVAAAESSTRDRLVIELLYGSGGRVSEIAQLRVEDIDFDEAFVSLFGKGSKERSNPIHEGCVELIRLYMEEYGITSGYLFPHRGDSARHITREAIGKIVKRVAAKAGIDPNKVSPHVFRHSFATHLIDNGCDMAQVQELLGHEDISTTKIYARITKKSKQASYVKFHPLATKSV